MKTKKMKLVKFKCPHCKKVIDKWYTATFSYEVAKEKKVSNRKRD